MADFKDELSPKLVAHLGHELAEAAKLAGTSTSFNQATFRTARRRRPRPAQTKSSHGLDRPRPSRLLCRPPPRGPIASSAPLLRTTACMDGRPCPSTLTLLRRCSIVQISRSPPSRSHSSLHRRIRYPSIHRRSLRVHDEPATHVDHPSRRTRAAAASGGYSQRLPWGARLTRFIADPLPTLELLEMPVNDESTYVRRSVANHLNDISKDHPARVLDTATRWVHSSTRGDFVVRHGLRTLIKQGHPAALAILGFDSDAQIELVDLSCSPSIISIGKQDHYFLHAARHPRGTNSH